MYFRFLPRHVYYALLRRAIGTGEGAGSGGRSPPRCFRSLDPFTLFQSEGTDYAHYITSTGPHQIFAPSYGPEL